MRVGHGDVLEVAVGTGLNLQYYPTDTRSPSMLDIAQQRAHELGRSVDLRLGDAQHLDFPDESYDAVVFSLALCTIPDPVKALAESGRVLRPGGLLLLLEHVRSRVIIVRVVQTLLEPFAVRLWDDHLLRDPLDHLGSFVVESVERRALGVIELVLARKPW